MMEQIRVLQQMTQLIMMNPERLRERTEEQKDTEQTSWVRQKRHKTVTYHCSNIFSAAHRALWMGPS